MEKKFTKEFFPGIMISLAISFLLFIYAPIDMYCVNVSEFLFRIWDLLPVVTMLFLITFAVMLGIYAILYRLHRNLYRVGIALGMIVFLSTYIQGNFLVSDLPPLDGTTVNWGNYDRWRLPCIIVWIAVTLVICLIWFCGRKIFYQGIVPFVCGCMTLMLFVTIVSEMITNEVFVEKTDFVATEENEFTMSKNKNFVILLLDALDARTFSDMLDSHAEYKDMFSDFTYYANTMSGYPYTKHSVPYIISGEWYENEKAFEEYMVDVYQAPIFNEFRQRGYQLDYYENELMIDSRDMKEMPFENVSKETFQTKLNLQFMIQEMKLIGFRYAPYDLKKAFFLKKSGFDELSVVVRDIGAPLFSDSDKEFYDKIREKQIEIDECDGYFKFIHLEGAHVPFVYDVNVDIIDEEQGDYEQNIEACMTLTKAYLDKLKAAGAYDNTVLIIMADHGYQEDDVAWGRQCPILLIKGFDEKHDTLQISTAPIAHEDLQQAYVRLLDGAQGSEVFDWEEGDVRERRFLYYKYLHDDQMEEYIQKGDAADLNTLLPTGRVFSR